MIAHAGLIAVAVGGVWRGALIEGPSGSGKSDLALRCLDAGARLVADDRVVLWRDQDRLYGRAPDALSGLLEVRGLGIIRTTPLAFCAIDLVVTCVPGPDAVERLPDGERVERADLPLPCHRLWPFEPSAPLKLIGHIQRVGQRR
ncbi:MAG: HPr kinase/phosphorylase [Caulobacter sp.]|nr:HPr kinase/phosphorylase [Caulobacter sp.]